MAAFSTLVALALVIYGAYGIAAARADDPGGPMMPVMMVFIACFISVATTIFIVMPSWALSEALRIKFDIPTAFTLMIVAVCVFVGSVLERVGNGTLTDGAYCTGYVCMGFAVYFAVYHAEEIFNRLCSRFSRSQRDQKAH